MSQNNQPSRYDDSNIFAKMLNGDIPYHKVYEDDKTLAFMDIMPQVMYWLFPNKKQSIWLIWSQNMRQRY